MTISESLVRKTEAFVVKSFENVSRNLSVAHDFRHVDRVRNWALMIAREEGFNEPGLVEITALLHDIGLVFVPDEGEKGYVQLPPHGPLGADMAVKYLEENSDLSPDIIHQITDAVRHHSDPPLIVEGHLRELGEKGKLLEIIRDADCLDAVGAVGVMRAFMSKSFLPEYDPENVKGEGWDLTPSGFKEKFGFEWKAGLAPVNTVIDQVNQQIGYFQVFHTETARKYAAPLIEFMKQFVIQLEKEVTH
ncbi:MAG: HD domain-containing protein [Dehalococcoidales bacterium]|nr:HD domain-containing protein [Dehalococcoidales bacterium]